MGTNTFSAIYLFTVFYISKLFERYHKLQPTSRHNTVDTCIIYIVSNITIFSYRFLPFVTDVYRIYFIDF